MLKFKLMLVVLLSLVFAPGCAWLRAELTDACAMVQPSIQQAEGYVVDVEAWGQQVEPYVAGDPVLAAAVAVVLADARAVQVVLNGADVLCQAVDSTGLFSQLVSDYGKYEVLQSAKLKGSQQLPVSPPAIVLAARKKAVRQ